METKVHFFEKQTIHNDILQSVWFLSAFVYVHKGLGSKVDPVNN